MARETARRFRPWAAEFRRGFHLPGRPGIHAGADDARAAASLVAVRVAEPVLLAAGFAGRLRARPLRIPLPAAVPGRHRLVAAPGCDDQAIRSGGEAASLGSFLVAGRRGF